MKDIKKPQFMLEAATKKGHNVFIEIGIALIIFFVGSLSTSIFQVPGMMGYLLKNETYMHMMITGEIDMQKMMDVVRDLPEWFKILSLLSEIGLIGIILLYCRFLEKRKFKTMGFAAKGMPLQYIKGLLYGFAAFSIAYLICIITGSIKFNGVSSNIIPLYIVGYFAGYLIQGMAEEVLCRGYLFVSLSRRYHVTTSIFVSSLFFACLHSANAGLSFIAFLNLILFGVFAALLLVKCENIWIVGAFHSIWNFVQGDLYGIQVSGMAVSNSIFTSEMVSGREIINGGSFGMEGGIAVTAVLLAGISYIVYSLNKEGKLIDKSTQPSYIEIETERIVKEMEKEMNGQMNNPFENPMRRNNNSPYENMYASEPVHKPIENMPVQAEDSEPEQVQENVKTEFDQNYFQ